MVFESKLDGFLSPNLILNKKFDSKTIKHFFIKQQTSLFGRKKYAKFFFKHPMSYLKKY